MTETLGPFELDVSKLQLNDRPETTEQTTLFPKITGKTSGLIYNYNHFIRESLSLNADTPLPRDKTTLRLTGTVKLHGTHADLVVYPNNNFRVQSRNQLSLGPQNDNYGCATHLFLWKREILSLRDKFTQRYLELNPGSKIDKEDSIIIAGEWVGPGVQKKVALNSLKKKCLVILSACINGKWLPDEGYEDIHAEEAGIYNISRGGIFRTTLDVDSPEVALQEIQDMTLEVEKECPFSKSFGVSGIGEGIVWKAEPPFGEDASFWIKTKGPLHRHTYVDKLKENELKGQIDGKVKARQFADAAVTEMRLEQAWDYLGEMGIKKDKAGVKEMVKWMWKDIETEEKTSIEETRVDKLLLKSAVTANTRYWYFKKAELL